MSLLRRFSLPLVAVLLLPESVSAQAPKNFSELVEQLTGIIDLATLTLIIAGFAVYFWGISVNIVKFEDDPEKRKGYFIWGLIVLFVMISVWGIIGILQNTLFGSSLLVPSGGGQTPALEAETPWTAHSVGGGFGL